MLEKPRFPKPASLKVHVRLEPLRPELAEIKCGLSANTRIGAIRSRADVIVVVAAGIPIFFRLPCIFPHQPLINDVNTPFAIIIRI
jgi:hypothetical protein